MTFKTTSKYGFHTSIFCCLSGIGSRGENSSSRDPHVFLSPAISWDYIIYNLSSESWSFLWDMSKPPPSGGVQWASWPDEDQKSSSCMPRPSLATKLLILHPRMSSAALQMKLISIACIHDLILLVSIYFFLLSFNPARDTGATPWSQAWGRRALDGPTRHSPCSINRTTLLWIQHL